MKQIFNSDYNPLDLTEINRKKLEARHRGTTPESVRRNVFAHGGAVKQVSIPSVELEKGRASTHASMAEAFMGMLLTNTPQNVESHGSDIAFNKTAEKAAQQSGTNPKNFPLKLQEYFNQKAEEGTGSTQFEIENEFLGKVVLMVTSQQGRLSVNVQAKHSLSKQQAQTLAHLVKVGLKTALNIENLEVAIG